MAAERLQDEAFRLYNVRAVSTTCVIDRSGRIARKITGGNRGDELREQGSIAGSAV